jgi:N-acetylglucosamine kinase-like BadF-type ATPase
VSSSPSPQLVKDILNYFLRNPKSADSLEGVTRWRLLEERVQRELEETDDALHWLVRRGFVTKLSPAWSEAVYRLNERNRAKAERFLKKAAALH